MLLKMTQMNDALRNLNNAGTPKMQFTGKILTISYYNYICGVYVSSNNDTIYILFGDDAPIQIPTYIQSLHFDSVNDNNIKEQITLKLAPNNQTNHNSLVFCNRYFEHLNKNFIILVQDETIDYMNVHTGSYHTQLINIPNEDYRHLTYNRENINAVEEIKIYFGFSINYFDYLLRNTPRSSKPYSNRNEALLLFPGKVDLFHDSIPICVCSHLPTSPKIMRLDIKPINNNNNTPFALTYDNHSSTQRNDDADSNNFKTPNRSSRIDISRSSINDNTFDDDDDDRASEELRESLSSKRVNEIRLPQHQMNNVMKLIGKDNDLQIHRRIKPRAAPIPDASNKNEDMQSQRPTSHIRFAKTIDELRKMRNAGKK